MVWLCWHALTRPRRQLAHTPQWVYGDIVTAVPGASVPPEMTVAATS